MEKISVVIENRETGKNELMTTVIKGYFISVSPRTGNKILVQAENGEIRKGVVDVARHINPKDIKVVLELLRSESTAQESNCMVSAFIERLICRLGEGDKDLKEWMIANKNHLLPELHVAWNAVAANHEIRDVDRKRFSIERAEQAVKEISS